jgi:hypothetical protein
MIVMAAAPQSHIPTEVYLDFLGRTVPIHWEYHAVLMFVIWMILIPLSIIAIRYGKPKPTPHGIREKVELANAARWWWFFVHKYILYAAIGALLVGTAVALLASRGFSGTVHSFFGIGTVILGCLQVVSSWFRGTHGGRYYYKADHDDPATWRGDHFNMTLRRRLFELFHKNVGYFACFFAVGAVASGLVQFPMPALMVVTLVTMLAIIALCLVLEHKGRNYDTYRAVFGNDPEHPFNQARKDL